MSYCLAVIAQYFFDHFFCRNVHDIGMMLADPEENSAL